MTPFTQGPVTLRYTNCGSWWLCINILGKFLLTAKQLSGILRSASGMPVLCLLKQLFEKRFPFSFELDFIWRKEIHSKPRCHAHDCMTEIFLFSYNSLQLLLTLILKTAEKGTILVQIWSKTKNDFICMVCGTISDKTWLPIYSTPIRCVLPKYSGALF